MRRTRPLSPRTTSCNNRGPPRHPRRRHRRHCAHVAEQSQSRSRRRRPPPGGAGGGASHRSRSFPSLEDCRTARPEKARDAPQEGGMCDLGPPLGRVFWGLLIPWLCPPAPETLGFLRLFFFLFFFHSPSDGLLALSAVTKLACALSVT